MEWSYSKNRTVSVLERLLEPPRPQKKFYEYFICFRKNKPDKGESMSMSYS